MHTCYNREVKDFASDAQWRRQRLTLWELHERVLRGGKSISPIFRVPWLTLRCFRIDWLHAADLGVSPTFLGNLFYVVSTKLDGRTFKDRIQGLWERVQDHYMRNDIEDRMQNLTPTMVRQAGKAPKLRCNAAQCRALVGFGATIAETLLDAENPREQAMITAARHLNECYKTLSGDSIFHADLLQEHSIRFAAAYVAISQTSTDPRFWRIKPKLHLFLELASEPGGQPSRCWTYRDEDWGGSVAQVARRRGGLLSVQAFSKSVLHHFKIHQPMIRMMG